MSSKKMENKNMDELYKKIIKKIVGDGKRIREKSGKIQNIAVTKKWLTEEDLRIERELKQIIKAFNPKHEFYAEEENEIFFDAEDVWVVDPISGTHVFINGLPHYGIVVSHLHNKIVQFAAVYDPSMDNLYTAYKNKGTFLNGQKVSVKKPDKDRVKIIFNLSTSWKDATVARRLFERLFEFGNFDIYRVPASHSVNDSLVACGKYDGVISLTKDSFPYFASSLIIQEAGGVFTNINGEANIKASDRVFIGGEKETYEQLKILVQGVY